MRADADDGVNAITESSSQKALVAIMQPYLFPYIGYYQLLRCSDIFVLFDDVNFIKRGYVNRNTLLFNGRPQQFTLPVLNGSQNRLIKDVEFTAESRKLIKRIRHNYARAPFLNQVFPLVESVLNQKKRGVVDVCQASLTRVMTYLDLSFDLRHSSSIDYDRSATAAGKLISICRQLGSERYVNAIGGQRMYNAEEFSRNGVSLSFIRMRDVSYSQGPRAFVDNLSIIDALMWCPKERIRKLLSSYDIV